MDDRLVVTYADMGELLEELVAALPDWGPFLYVFGPPRGGLPMAVHLSHRLGVPMILDVEDIPDVWPPVPGGRLLVVDDVADGGATLGELTARLHGWGVSYVTAALFLKPHSLYRPDIVLRETSQWIVFPWEDPGEPRNR